MLEALAVSQLFAFFTLFSRLGAGLMLLPGFGEAYVSPRTRLLFALAFSFVLSPIIAPSLPAMPGTIAGLFLYLSKEIFIGLFIGAMTRILLSTMHTLGMIIAYQSGLASASMFDVNQSAQGSIFGNFLSIVAVVVLFSMNLHHAMLTSLRDSYELFPAGGALNMGDFAETFMQLIGSVFMMAVKLSAPFLIIGIIVNLGGGVLTRMMPTMQVFFVLMPAQIVLSLFLLMTLMPAMVMWYLEYFQGALAGNLPR